MSNQMSFWWKTSAFCYAVFTFLGKMKKKRCEVGLEGGGGDLQRDIIITLTKAISLVHFCKTR